MSQYDITVFYAFHGSPDEEHQEFPAQSLPADRIQLIPVVEDDLYHPRRRTLERICEASGSYVLMLDEGDVPEPEDTFLETMLSHADKLHKKAAFFMPSLRFTLLEETDHGFFSVSIPSDFSVPVNILPTVLPTDLHGLLIPTDPLKEAVAHAGEIEPEKAILLDLLRQNPVFFYAGSCCIHYLLPRESDFQYDMRCMSHEWYYDPFEQFLLPILEEEQRQGREINRLLQTLALHMIHIRVLANTDNRNKHVVRPEEVPDYMELFSRVLQFVDIENILSMKTMATAPTLRNRLFYIRLKKRDFSWYPEIAITGQKLDLLCKYDRFGGLESIPVQLNLIDYKDGCLEIDGSINDYFRAEDASVYVKFGKNNYPIVYNQRFSLAKCFGVTYSRLKTFHVSVPIPPDSKPRLLSFVINSNDRETPMGYAFPSHTSRFTKDFSYTYWLFGDYLSYWNQEGIHIIKAKKWKILYKEFRLWMQIFRAKDGLFRNQLPLKILNFLLRPYYSRQQIWLFLDKIYKGGDSSEYIYRYAARQKDGIKKYYLLDKETSDYKRMVKEGYHPLVRGSLKHRLVFLNADLIIASNSTVFAFNDYPFQRALPIRGDVHSEVACVQHGMSVQKIALAQQRLRDNTKLYFCASKYEIENLSKPVYDYQGYDALKLTGVPRYDGLKDRAEKIILLSPTWRMNSALPVTKNEGVSRDYNPHFRDTDYYRVYNGLINDPRLLESARKYGYRIQYVLHPIVSPQAEDFTKNDFVEIIPAIGDMSYEKIFCEAALMVTDFSGVQFDFAYMRKPVVYLHHNDIPQHYEEGTFHYTTMGFGEICHTNDELIDVLCRYMENGCKMPKLYRDRADDFFEFSDNNNCERIYPVMLEYQRKRRSQK